ncbi:MAG: tRNA pseudouridine synthase A [Actinomycetota bacterium]|nr:tRNA pseudouridine synthase A [Actinomycetota bacterium]
MEPSPETVRVRLDVAYDGTAFAGWAAQPALRTVEGTLSRALTTMMRAHGPVRLTVAGRTDAGVHARGQVVHADVDRVAWAQLPARSDRSPEQAARTRLAGILPPDLVVGRASLAPAGFNARFSATQRRYSYRIADAGATKDPLRRHDTVHLRRSLDVGLMHAASRNLLGLKDFAAFCRRREGATTVRTLIDYSWERHDDGVIEGTVVADAFCHSMVRALVGAVVPVGDGKRSVDWPLRVRQGGQRDPAVVVMPPHGLSLEEVTYPPDDEVAVRAQESRTVRRLP